MMDRQVKDIPLAPSLHVDKAHIEFRNVSFSYSTRHSFP